MAVEYRGVQWNAHKRLYDAAVVAILVVFVVVFVGVGLLGPSGGPDPVTLLIRATGVAAVTMLHLILAIGPLARLTPRFAPVLYNRRHFGVLLFFVALVHGLLVTLWFGAFGEGNPLANVLVGTAPGAFPFELLGFAALAILFVMAATSHDFWLHTLTPAAWKALHMAVYVAYALVLGHVALGAMQSEGGLVAPALLAGGLVALTGLHLAAGLRENARETGSASGDGWIDAGPVDDLAEGRAAMVNLPAGSRVERVAVFRSGGVLRAVQGSCPHQGGPLAEGKVVDGCVTCPWHGYQFQVEDGCSPPPFEDRVELFPVRITAGRVEVATAPSPDVKPTPIEPAQTGAAQAEPGQTEPISTEQSQSEPARASSNTGQQEGSDA
ncbi:MAG: Rieske 2Fe-2S domain-containing protein [Planctomycetota bacterium]